MSELDSHSLGQRGQRRQREEAVRSVASMGHLDRRPRHLGLHWCMTECPYRTCLPRSVAAPQATKMQCCACSPQLRVRPPTCFPSPLLQATRTRCCARLRGSRTLPATAWPPGSTPRPSLWPSPPETTPWSTLLPVGGRRHCGSESPPGELLASGCSPWLTHRAPGLPSLAILSPLPTAANRTVDPAMGLSYRDTDQSAAGPNFHPLIQQKRLVTGQRKGDTPQVVRVRRSYPAFCRQVLHRFHGSMLPTTTTPACMALSPAACLLAMPAMLPWRGMHPAATKSSARRSSSTAACPSRPRRAASSMPLASTRASSL